FALQRSDLRVLAEVEKQTWKIRQVPDPRNRSRNHHRLERVCQTLFMLPYAMTYRQKQERRGHESCEQPFREQPECADEAEKPAPERRFEAITPDEKHPCDGDPCRQPVIENCFARHPDQIWRQQLQDAGPSRSG